MHILLDLHLKSKYNIEALINSGYKSNAITLI